MEFTAVFIAIISLLGSLYATFTQSKNNKIPNETNSFTAQINAAKVIMQELREELDRQKVIIKELKDEINSLKSQEKTYLIEKIRMEEKLEQLSLENTKLHFEIENNRILYTNQIDNLNIEIDSLRKELTKYKKLK
jgi:chromosome segregation ATPase